MRRLLAISNHGEMIGGGEQSFLEMLSHLAASWEGFTAVPLEGELADRLRNNDLFVRTLAMPPLSPTRAPSVLKALLSHVRTCRDLRPDLIYANGSRAVFYGGLAGKLLGIPVIWHCRIAGHDPYMDFFLCRLSNCIIANSKATGKRFHPRFSSKVCVVYNGVNLYWLQQNDGSKPEIIQEGWKVILVVARLSRDKRHDILLSAFEHVARPHPDLHLVFLGRMDSSDPAWWQELQTRTLRSPYSERIHWVGHVEDVRPWYRAACFLALASENESFGRVIVEAMACRLPVIATRVGGIPEIVRENKDGLLVTPGNIAEMAEGFSRFLRDESLRLLLIKSGLERAKNFDIKTHIDQMIRIFEDCVKE